MSEPHPAAPPPAARRSPGSGVVTVATAAVVFASLGSVGCDSINDIYKRDTGVMEPVPAPSQNYTPVTGPAPRPDADPLDPAAAAGGPPEVLDGDAPEPVDDADAFADAAAGEASTAEPAPTEIYVVEKGDTLGHISQKLYGTVRRTVDLQNANPDVDPRKMQIGDELKVPRP